MKTLRAIITSIVVGTFLSFVGFTFIRSLTLSTVFAPLLAAAPPALLISSELYAVAVSAVNPLLALVLSLSYLRVPGNLAGYLKFVTLGPFSLMLMYYILVAVAWTLVLRDVTKGKKASG